MNRCLRIMTAGVLMALLATPVEGNDDPGTTVSWRRAVLKAMQAACAEARPSGCPSLEPEADARRAAPMALLPAGAPTRQPPPTGSEPSTVRWRVYFEGNSFHIEELEILTSRADLTVFQPPGQVVSQQSIDNTATLRLNSNYSVSGKAASTGIWVDWNQPGEDRISVAASAGALYGDVDVDRTDLTLNTVTKTGGNDWGGSVRAEILFTPEPGEPLFLYGEGGWHFLNLDARRDPPELIPGATIELDASRFSFRQFSVGAGAGMFFGSGQKYGVRAGIASYHLDIDIERSLSFTFPGLNQRQEFSGLIELDHELLAFVTLFEVRPSPVVEFDARMMFSGGMWDLGVMGKIRF